MRPPNLERMEAQAAREKAIAAQGGKCIASCGTTYTLKNPACQDHDHVTGVDRQIICRQCNMTLGLMGEDPERILGLYKYAVKAKAARESVQKVVASAFASVAVDESLSSPEGP